MSAPAAAPPANSAAGPTATILSSTLLRAPATAADDSTVHSMVLSPIDWLIKPYYAVQIVMFYARPGDFPGDQEIMPAARMAQAYSHLLSHYAPFAGRFHKQPDGSVQIRYGGSANLGVPFVSASCEATVASLPLSAERYTSIDALPASLQLLAPFDGSVDPLSHPPVWLQHTRFSCGGVCLGVHFHHFLGDAPALLKMVRDWVELYGALGAAPDAIPTLSKPPVLDRLSVVPKWESPEAQAADAARFCKEMYTDVEPAAPGAAASGASAKPQRSVSRVVRFSGAELARMVRDAADKSKGCTAPWISTYEALAAHMMESIHRARNPEWEIDPLTAATAAAPAAAVAPSASSSSSSSAPALPFTPITGPHVVTCAVSINFRSHLNLSADLISNAVLKLYVGVPSAVAHDPNNGLAATASAVHDAIARFTPDLVKRTAAWTFSLADKNAIYLAERPADKLTLSSWAKFNAHQLATFDPGCVPLRICRPYSASWTNGLVHFFSAGPEDEGAIDVNIGFFEPDMERLMSDPRFRRFK